MTLRWDHLKNTGQKSASGSKVTPAIVALIDTEIVALFLLTFITTNMFTHMLSYVKGWIFEPLSPKSDQHHISPYSIILQIEKVRRIKGMITKWKLHAMVVN